MNRAPIEAVAVVVPIRNEEDLLPRCLACLRRAVDGIARADSPLVTVPLVTVVLVLDSCTDRSEAIATASGFNVISVDAGAVGVARATGVREALRLIGEERAERVWIANTDSDSAVPANWLTSHVAHANAGADLLVGTVEPDFRDLDHASRSWWMAAHPPEVSEGDIHGANLGIRADRYLGAGGFAPLAEHEDVMLARRLTALGAKVVSTDECRVTTSGRSIGRTPGGFARFIRELPLREAGVAR